MTMPNFLVIGAMKSGTTSLHHYLRQHPEIYVSAVKEPSFFAFEGSTLEFDGPEGRSRTRRLMKRYFVTDVDAYGALFGGVAGEKAVGEVSPLYLYDGGAPNRIKRYVPGAKLIAVLRHPAERAYSAFLYLSRDGREPLRDFAAALRAEDARIRGNWEWIWHYRTMGLYHAQLGRYFDAFARDQIRVYLYEDLQSDPVALLQDVFGFLAVDASFTPDMSARHNPSGIPRSTMLLRLMNRPNAVRNVLRPIVPPRLRRLLRAHVEARVLAPPPPLDGEIRRELIRAYSDDVRKLEHLIGRDLSRWLQ